MAATKTTSKTTRSTPHPQAPRHLVCAFTSPATTEAEGTLRLVRGRGVYVWDDRGRRYLDGLASLWNVNVGHGRRRIAAAVAKQIRRLEFAPSLLGFSSIPAERLATRIAALAPPGLERVVFTSGGSEANETVLRLVRLYWRLRGRTDKFKFVSLDRAYHGSSTGAASLTGLPFFHQHYEPLLPGVVRIPRPHCYRCPLGRTFPTCALACADELERTIEREGAETIAAFIAEPVQGVGGVVVPPAGYFERIRAICDRHDILFVVDEVITGFGRLGTAFGINRSNVVPDVIAFAKGITSGYQPLGGVILHERIYQTLVDQGPGFALHHGFTYSGHPAACAAGLANLDILEKEKLFARVDRLAPEFAARVHALARHAIVGDTRASGLMGAIELVREPASRTPFAAEERIPQRIRAACMKRGVLVRASPDIIAVCPPFIIKRKQLDRLFDTLDAALTEVGSELAANATGPS